MKEIIAKCTAIILLMLIMALPILFIMGMYSSGLLYFGITYEKPSDFVLFVIMSVVLGGIIEYLFTILVQVSYDLKKINKKQSIFFKVIFDFSTSVFSLLVVDYFMDSLNTSVKSVLFTSLFATGISYLIPNDKEEVNDGKVDLALSNEIQNLLDENKVMDSINIIRQRHPELSIRQAKKHVQQIREAENE